MRRMILATIGFLLLCAGSAVQQSMRVEWVLDNLSSIGGHAVSLIGTPRVVDTPLGKAVEFNGVTDGLLVDINPLQGLKQFTVEALFEPAADGAAEQRFLHISETGSEKRVMMETRILPGPSWCLDTFLRDAAPGLTLIDRTATHLAASWHVASLVYDGKTMAHYVDGKREAEGPVDFGPLGAGRTSIGVRQNLVSWFKGRIRLVRISAVPLAPAQQLTIPAR